MGDAYSVPVNRLKGFQILLGNFIEVFSLGPVLIAFFCNRFPVKLDHLVQVSRYAAEDFFSNPA